MDLLYLDIELPGPSGVEIGRYIRETLGNLMVQIVYISAYRHYAMELFCISPLHFLVKPLDKCMVYLTLNRAFSLLRYGCQVFSYQTGREMRRIPINEIYYFKSLGREVELHTARGVEQFYSSLERVYHQLMDHRFFTATNHILSIITKSTEFPAKR